MSLTDLADIGEFVGGIAVIVTLIYLAVQLKQSSKMAQANAVATLLARYESPNAILAGSSAASRVFRLGTRGSDELTEDEAMQYQCMLLQFMAVLYASYKFHNDRIISREQWEIYRRDIAEFMDQPGFVQMFPYFETYYSPDPGFIEELARMKMEKHPKSGLSFMESIQRDAGVVKPPSNNEMESNT